ncbi:hypothetical protein [Thermotalea metallivorans]|uniref:Uncharacterized protein n=1 Tax=Thermotalea metallivorans TaxID=520762 RepID=A0A140L0X5_9FIRM|nr:hypothetical protein [Thermotalea metallivorans]KXG74200.1 hypothetical protein AN619_25180 [Thermotalea metallivorans]
MSIEFFKKTFHEIIEGKNTPESLDAEAYCFALGQALHRIFDALGGIDQHRREFNYLTNPYLPADIRTLCIRILRFLKNTRNLLDFQDQQLMTTLDFLISQEDIFLRSKIDFKKCEEAFYAGLFW